MDKDFRFAVGCCAAVVVSIIIGMTIADINTTNRLAESAHPLELACAWASREHISPQCLAVPHGEIKP